MYSRSNRWLSFLAWTGGALAISILASAEVAHAQLRVVTWNTATAKVGGIQSARTGSDIVLTAIGEELVNGVQRPIDVLFLQEQWTMSTATQSFVNILNSIYGTPEVPFPYARSVINGATSSIDGDAGRPGLIWNTTTVSRIDEVAFGTVNGTNQARSTMRYQIRPLGEDGEEVYGVAADFYGYNSHYKAGSTATDKNRRNIEATSIRENVDYGSNALGEGAHALFVGDYNIQSSFEDSYVTLLDGSDPIPANNAGQAVDPISSPGNWSNASGFASIHTQSPCSSGCGDLTTGGMDDRFDFQLMTGEFLDNEGLSYISGSYRAFGNGGVSFNDNINNADNINTGDGDGYAFNGLTSYTRTDVLNALKTAGDHLPVVADYQLPAVLSAIADAVPSTLFQGQDFDLDISVWNSAFVGVANGADELDYSLDATGDLSGDVAGGMDSALGAMNVHPVGFDTSSLGMKSGTITVMSNSQQVGSGPGVVGGVWTLNVMYEVLPFSGIMGDYNGNNAVDSADYSVWRDALEAGSSSLTNDPTPGSVTESDFEYWRDHFGEALGGGAGSGSAVPEPSTFAMLLWAVCLARLAGGKLGSWTRRS